MLPMDVDVMPGMQSGMPSPGQQTSHPSAIIPPRRKPNKDESKADRLPYFHGRFSSLEEVTSKFSSQSVVQG